MKVIYDVKYKFKAKDDISNEEFSRLFNRKLLNVIMNLENEELLKLH